MRAVFSEIERIYMFKLVCLYLGVLLTMVSACCSQEAQAITNERITIMNDQKISNPWIEKVNDSLSSMSGMFPVKDTIGTLLVLAWHKIVPHSDQLNRTIRAVSGILVDVYAEMEIQFAQKHPETISSEMFLKPLEPLLKDGVGKVDWKQAQEVLRDHFQQFFAVTDFAKYSGADDVQIFVIAQDLQSGENLGVIQFLITPEFDYGTVKVAFFGVAQKTEHRGIDELLVSCVFKLLPEVRRIFLHTRITNEKVLDFYRSLGFAPFPGPMAFWADLEYLSDASDVLQEKSASFNK